MRRIYLYLHVYLYLKIGFPLTQLSIEFFSKPFAPCLLVEVVKHGRREHARCSVEELGLSAHRMLADVVAQVLPERRRIAGQLALLHLVPDGDTLLGIPIVAGRCVRRVSVEGRLVG